MNFAIVPYRVRLTGLLVIAGIMAACADADDASPAPSGEPAAPVIADAAAKRTNPDGDTTTPAVVAAIGDGVAGTSASLPVVLTDPTGTATPISPDATGVIDKEHGTPVSSGAGRRLNDTGTTGCSNAQSGDLPCADPTVGTDLYPGQDAEYGRDVTHDDDSDGHAGFQLTKLDTAGAPLADQSVDYGTQPWSCVRDEVTGLTWEVKTDDGDLRDRDWRYSWFDPMGFHTSGSAGFPNGGRCADSENCDTDKYVAAVNATTLCGFADWRLPERSELLSLVDYGAVEAPAAPGAMTPYIDNTRFPNVSIGVAHWTRSDTSIAISKRTVEFKDGHSRTASVTAALAVRLVRGGQ